MQLAGPGVFGPPRDRGAALAVLREAVARRGEPSRTSDFYGPHVTNQIIREALHPYASDLVIVTKISARRGAHGSWIPAFSAEELLGQSTTISAISASMCSKWSICAACSNPLIPLRVDRSASDRPRGTSATRVGPPHRFEQCDVGAIAEGRQICEIVCVQNYYTLAIVTTMLSIEGLAREGIAYVPFFPLGGFNPLQSSDCPMWRPAWTPRRCRWLSPGCFAALPTFSLFPARHPSLICWKTWPAEVSICRKTP